MIIGLSAGIDYAIVFLMSAQALVTDNADNTNLFPEKVVIPTVFILGNEEPVKMTFSDETKARIANCPMQKVAEQKVI